MNTDEKRKPISTCIVYVTENKKKSNKTQKAF